MGAYGNSPETAFDGVRVQNNATITATGNSGTTVGNGVVDTLGWDGGFCTFYLVVGASTGTSQTLDVLVQEDTASSFAAAATVTGATFTQLTSSRDDDIFVGRVRCQGTERYLRLAWTAAGTSPSFPLTAVAILSGAADSAEADDTFDFTVG
jgi:hypothetical protein